jgi:hypothetical protein
MSKEKHYRILSEFHIDADLFQFLESVATKDEDLSIEKILNDLLRAKIEEEKIKSARYNEIRNSLINDTEFLQELKEILAA